MSQDIKAELQKTITAIASMAGKTFAEVATELKARGGSIVEQAAKWRAELEAAMLDVPAPAPTPEPEEELDVETATVSFADGMKSLEEQVAYSGMKYASLKKIQELQAADPKFAIKPTGEAFLKKVSKFTRDVKENGAIVYEKDAAGNVIYDDKNGVKVPRAKVEHPIETYLPCVDRNGQKYLLNMNWGFTKEFPAFYKANGICFFRAVATGSPATKNYKVSISKA
jgi:hypothetical protein